MPAMLGSVHSPFPLLGGEGLKRAGRELTREKLVDALDTLKNFETGGITAPLTYAPGKRRPFNAGYFLKADPIKEKWVKISD